MERHVKLLQIMDANLNRAREGLRVCEDIARFALVDKDAAIALKGIRHSVTAVLLRSKSLSLRKLVQTRDTEKDILKYVDFSKCRKRHIEDILMANIERVKESLRVLEECSKIIDEDMSRKYRRLRFKAYDVEKKVVAGTRAVSGGR